LSFAIIGLRIREKVRKYDLVKVIVNYSTTEKRYVIMADKKISKLYIEQPIVQSLVGNIYLGIVTKVLPGMNAAFIEIGEEKQGFLHRDKLASFVHTANDPIQRDQKSISSFVHQGERILVQVEKDAMGTKGARLSGLIEFQGENIIYQPDGAFVATSQKIEDSLKRDELKALGESITQDKEGLIFRTSSAKANVEEIQTEFHQLRKQYEQLQKDALSCKGPELLLAKDLFLSQLFEDLNLISQGEIWVDDLKLKQKLESVLRLKRLDSQITLQYYQEKENIFSAMTVNNEVEKALKRLVWLNSGAYIVIDETEALTIFDVNSGKFVGKSNRQMTVNQVNVEAAIEVARQIILRDIGGIVLVDFIDMKLESERQTIIQTLSSEFKKDAKKPKIIGFTELGILQLTRRKTKPTLSETLLTKCPTCEGTGRVYSAESVAFRLERELWEYRQSDYSAVHVTTTAEVYQLFSGENAVHQHRLEELTGLKIHFTSEQRAKPFYEITKLDSL
jgi:ribonuclease G